jgi:uncharacterized protein
VGKGTTMTQPFHVIAKPSSAKCNLDCSYCFYNERTKPNAGDMTLATLETFTRQYIRSQPDAPEVNFAWQGGEPTLRGLEFYREAVRFQKVYGKEGQCISNSFQTNGVLLDTEWAEFFRSAGFLIGLSIDGPHHDKLRKDHGGGKSLAPTLRAADLLRKHGVPYNTLTCVSAANQDHGRETYEFLRDVAKSTHLQFIPIVGPEDQCTPEGYGAFMNDVFDAWSDGDFGKVTIKYFEDQVAIAIGQQPDECTLRPTCGRALAIEATGEVYSCDHFVDDNNWVGHLDPQGKEQVPQIELAEAVESFKQTEFGQSKFTSLPQKCRECAMLQYCWGGCPKDRGPDGVNYLCEGFRAIFRHTHSRVAAVAATLILQEAK